MATKKKQETNKITVVYKGVEYDVCFTLNVMEIIQEKYGSFQAWGELVEDEAEPNIKDIKFGFTEAINEGVEIWNDEHEEKKEPLTEKQVGRLLTEIGLNSAAGLLRKSVVESTKSDEKNS